MLPRSPALLWDMMDAARFILSHTGQSTLETYQQDIMLRSAVERQFEIIGEAARRLANDDPAIATRVTDLSQIIAFRNVLAHAYDQIDHARVWEVITNALPTLFSEVETLLGEVERNQ